MEKYFYSSSFRIASAPCGVGCLGGGAQGCSEHPVLDADHVGVRPVCRTAGNQQVFAGLFTLLTTFSMRVDLPDRGGPVRRMFESGI